MLPENILFTSSPADALGDFVKKHSYSRIIALVDNNTRKFCLPHLAKNDLFDDVIEVQAGEEHKTLATCEYIWSQMTALQLDRHALLVVIGGGVLGDMGGFCAATYKRGIDFILTPTTLLAQVDASIGGKLGVDFNSFKNHIGVFQLPVLTLIHSGFLQTLPPDELRSGYAEVIKHCLISDGEMWNKIITQPLDQQDWETLIKHSVSFKADVTTKDPKEKGLRKILNAGHTVGHAVESYLLASGHKIMHGEAIAVGLIAESEIAVTKGFLRKDEFEQITSYLVKTFGKVDLSETQIKEAAILAAQDKKNKGNKILCVMLESIGKARWDVEITTEEIETSLRDYTSR